jgi:hypothetical protein
VRNWFGDSGLVAAVCKWGDNSGEVFRVRMHCFESGTFFWVKTYDLRSGDNNACELFFFLETSLLKYLDFRDCLGGVCAADIRTETL